MWSWISHTRICFSQWLLSIIQPLTDVKCDRKTRWTCPCLARISETDTKRCVCCNYLMCHQSVSCGCAKLGKQQWWRTRRWNEAGRQKNLEEQRQNPTNRAANVLSLSITARACLGFRKSLPSRINRAAWERRWTRLDRTCTEGMVKTVFQTSNRERWTSFNPLPKLVIVARSSNENCVAPELEQAWLRWLFRNCDINRIDGMHRYTGTLTDDHYQITGDAQPMRSKPKEIKSGVGNSGYEVI